jgi:WD40 repeat protein
VVAFSPDGTLIASGSHDGSVKLWNVVKCLEVSKVLGGTIGRRFKFRKCRSIACSKKGVLSLKFSEDGKYLIIDGGRISLETEECVEIKSVKNLWVNGKWILYGAVAVLRLPPDFNPTCYDVRGNQVTIGFQNGRVLNFDIDCGRLDSELRLVSNSS